jgi:hypothetical protein
MSFAAVRDWGQSCDVTSIGLLVPLTVGLDDEVFGAARGCLQLKFIIPNSDS